MLKMGKDFKIGDLVIVKKPENHTEGPGWNDSMDKATEGIKTIKIVSHYSKTCRLKEIGYIYHFDWLIKV